MFSISCDRYTVSCEVWELPFLHEEYRKCARLVEEIGLEETEGDIWFIAVADDSNLPFLVVIQRFSPAEPCFSPGILLIPETKLLLIGAGERLLAYDLAKPARLWEDKADTGFWRWKRHENMVVMSAELELAAWDLEGRKKWSTFVEPPWSYTVADGEVSLEVMGRRSKFPLRGGPERPK